MVHNLHVGPFLWILGQIVSKKKILKILRFFQKKKVIQIKSRKDDKNALTFVPKLNIFQISLKWDPW